MEEQINVNWWSHKPIEQIYVGIDEVMNDISSTPSLRYLRQKEPNIL